MTPTKEDYNRVKNKYHLKLNDFKDIKPNIVIKLDDLGCHEEDLLNYLFFACKGKEQKDKVRSLLYLYRQYNSRCPDYDYYSDPRNYWDEKWKFLRNYKVVPNTYGHPMEMPF